MEQCVTLYFHTSDFLSLHQFISDVFSYDEDDMVEDPYLAQHLAHFGINVAALEKVLWTLLIFVFPHCGTY